MYRNTAEITVTRSKMHNYGVKQGNKKINVAFEIDGSETLIIDDDKYIYEINYADIEALARRTRAERKSNDR